MGRERWDELTTFAMVRDPFARLVSCWGYALAKERQRVMEPEQFRQWVAEGCPLPSRFNMDLSRGRRVWVHAPQLEWLTDEAGRICVARLFRLENIDLDWRSILACAGAVGPPLTRANPSEHAPVATYYDEPTRELVRERYAGDFDALGYPR